MADEQRQEREDGDDEGSEQNQYGGGDQEMDAVEQTERVDEDDEE